MRTFVVKSGDTLSKIAKRNGVTMAQLIAANPSFAAHINEIRIGDVLNIPDGTGAPAAGPAPVVTPPPVGTPPQPQPSQGRVLGKLSEKFEVGKNGPGTVSSGAGDAGGASYGSYQMTSKPNGGTVKRFVSDPSFPFASRFAGLKPGAANFTAAWKQLAADDRVAFQESQHEFIKRTHFDPLVHKIIAEDGLNVLTRSAALQDVIWSTAVQHGPGTDIPHRAIGTLTAQPVDPAFDRELIIAIYNERGRTNASGVLVHFAKNSKQVQSGVANRFKNEVKDALKMLDANA